ncbi:DUF3472 domain-containing protein [Burkholderia alba]|uniref:DUF3472 domain-containing protein n=1 Tax=Burkholderia alba TaxID=2683677 RepID=UPI002B05E81E|nr:DUF3472 domain-containing protein [Burkholderia alba]
MRQERERSPAVRGTGFAAGFSGAWGASTGGLARLMGMAVLLIGGVLAAAPGAQARTPTATFAASAGAPAFDRLEWDVNVLDFSEGPSTRWFWALQTSLAGGKVFYMGLQPQNMGKTDGRRALFSFFGAGTSAGAASCHGGADGGAGTSCMIHYDWQTGHPYRFTVTRAPHGAGQVTWTGTITDLVTNVTTKVGAVDVDARAGDIRPSSVGWAEWIMGHATTCAAKRGFVVKMDAPVGYRDGARHDEFVGRTLDADVPGSGCVTVSAVADRRAALMRINR